MKTFLLAIKNVVLWSYHRGSWQYDVLCILILAFIFLTPSDWFTPDPAPPAPAVEQPAPAAVNPPAKPETPDPAEKEKPEKPKEIPAKP